MCSECPRSFCMTCLTRVLTRKEIGDLEKPSDWICMCCNADISPSPPSLSSSQWKIVTPTNKIKPDYLIENISTSNDKSLLLDNDFLSSLSIPKRISRRDRRKYEKNTKKMKSSHNFGMENRNLEFEDKLLCSTKKSDNRDNLTDHDNDENQSLNDEESSINLTDELDLQDMTCFYLTRNKLKTFIDPVATISVITVPVVTNPVRKIHVVKIPIAVRIRDQKNAKLLLNENCLREEKIKKSIHNIRVRKRAHDENCKSRKLSLPVISNDKIIVNSSSAAKSGGENRHPIGEKENPARNNFAPGTTSGMKKSEVSDDESNPMPLPLSLPLSSSIVEDEVYYFSLYAQVCYIPCIFYFLTQNKISL